MITVSLSRFPAGISIMQYLYGDWCYSSTKPFFLRRVALKGSNYLARVLSEKKIN